MRKIKKGDSVKVIAGSHKGVKSTVNMVDGEKIYLHDVNKVKKAVKGQGFSEKEAPIHISNIAYFDEKLGKTTKVGIKIDEKTGKKVRYSKQSGNILPENSKKT